LTYRSSIFGFIFFFASHLFAASHPVHQISISGNERTKNFVILREMLIEVDSVYPENQIDELLKTSTNRLLNLNLFNQVEIKYSLSEYNKDTTFNIAVVVIEKWYVWPIPFVEFSDRNFNVWGNLDFDQARTNYGLYVFNYNLFGRNQTLKTHVKEGYNTNVGLEYRIPFLSRNTQWGLNALIKYASQNEVWYETRNDSLQFFKNGQNNLISTTEAKVELTKRITPFTSVYYGAYFEHGQLDSSVPINDYFINNQRFQRKYGLYFKIEYTTQNNIYFPTEGKYGSASFGVNTWQNQNYLFNGSLKTRLQQFDKLSSRWSSALSVYFEYNTNQNAPYSDRKILGYREVVRGYEHYVVDGTLGWKTNAALRYHLLNTELILTSIPIDNYQKLPVNIYAEGYIDGGYATSNQYHHSNHLNQQPIYSVGVGLNTLFYNDRLLRLEYSLNSLGEGGLFVHFKKAI
jgi:outer membrane protein assembly factor BamA